MSSNFYYEYTLYPEEGARDKLILSGKSQPTWGLSYCGETPACVSANPPSVLRLRDF